MKKTFVLLFLAAFISILVPTIYASQVSDSSRIKVEKVRIPQGTITIETKILTKEESENLELNQESYQSQYINMALTDFTWSPLNQTCSNGVRYSYSMTGSGLSAVILKWQSDDWGKLNECSSSNGCSYTYTTDWSAYYTKAGAAASETSEGDVLIPIGSYQCR